MLGTDDLNWADSRLAAFRRSGVESGHR